MLGRVMSRPSHTKTLNMDTKTHTSASTLSYAELRAAVLEALHVQHNGADNQKHLLRLLDEVECRIMDGVGLSQFLEQLRQTGRLA